MQDTQHLPGSEESESGGQRALSSSILPANICEVPYTGQKRAKSKADYRPNHGETAFMGRLSDPSSKEDVVDKVAFSPKHEWLEGTVQRLT